MLFLRISLLVSFTALTSLLSAQLVAEDALVSELPLAWSADRDFPDDFYLMHLPPHRSYTGLFPTEIAGTYELRPLSTEIRGHRLRLHEFIAPRWIFADRFTGPPQITRGVEPDTVLAPGDQLTLREGKLQATGNSQEGYALWFQRTHGPKELLLRTETSYRVKINFVGDLDGDWKDDLLLTLQASESLWYYGLWTTRDAPPGKWYRASLLRPVIY